jgi:uncharacterized protein YegL
MSATNELKPELVDQDLLGGVNERVACVLLLDTSASMQGEKIAELNKGLLTLKQSLEADETARLRAEIAIVTFGGTVQLMQPFTTVDNFTPPSLQAEGNTPMGEALELGLTILEDRKAIYRANGTKVWRPWVMLISDGAPTDNWADAAIKVRDGEERKKFSFYAIGVVGADMELLAQIAPVKTRPTLLRERNFTELFLWLSNSLAKTSASKAGTAIALPATDGWAQKEA